MFLIYFIFLKCYHFIIHLQFTIVSTEKEEGGDSPGHEEEELGATECPQQSPLCNEEDDEKWKIKFR